MDPHDLLKSVNEFYQQAWDKLLVFTTVLVALVGILIPVIQNLSQRTREKAIRKELEKYFAEKLKETEDKLVKEMDKKMQDKIEELQSAIEKRTEALNAGILMVQGNNSRRLKLFKSALLDYCLAGTSSLDAQDLFHLQRINENIRATLPNITKLELNSIAEEEEDQLNIYILKLEQNNKKGEYIDIISEFKRQILKIMKSEDVPKTI
jgi:hypothetical protein